VTRRAEQDGYDTAAFNSSPGPLRVQLPEPEAKLGRDEVGRREAPHRQPAAKLRHGYFEEAHQVTSTGTPLGFATTSHSNACSSTSPLPLMSASARSTVCSTPTSITKSAVPTGNTGDLKV